MKSLWIHYIYDLENLPIKVAVQRVVDVIKVNKVLLESHYEVHLIIVVSQLLIPHALLTRR